jgi:elongation factor Ts
VPSDLLTRERDVAAGQVVGKPANIIEKIVDGKIEKFYSTICLLEQAFIKNPEMSIQDLVKSKIAELGENIIIRRFTRYSVGEEIA